MANPTTTPIMPPATGPGGPFANPIYLVDQFGNPLQTPGNGLVAAGVPVVSLGLWNGGSNVDAMRGFNGGGPDNITFGIMAMVQAGYSGTTTANYLRTPTTYKAFNAQALTATTGNTPTSIWTPTTGKKFRIMGYWFSLSAAAGLVFHDLATVGGGGVIPIPSPLAAAAGIVQSPPIGNGYISTTINNQLWIDATASATVTGFVWGTEE